MKRVHRFIHIARIGATATPRISNLGRPNVEMELPAAAQIDMPPGAHALYVTISAEILDRPVAREGRSIVRSCIQREYSLVLLDMNLVRTANSEGLRWLARLKEAADWHNVTLLTRLSPALSLVIRSAGFTLPEFTPARLAGATPD
jgi:hypothetical protein